MINYKGIKRAIGLGGLVLALNGTTINALKKSPIEEEFDRLRKQVEITLLERGGNDKCNLRDLDFDGMVDEVYDKNGRLVPDENNLYRDVQEGYEILINDLYKKMQQRKASNH